MTITPINLFIVISAAWRLSSLVANEAGAFGMFEYLRDQARRLSECNRLCKLFRLYDGLTCEWCNSVWFGGAITAAWFALGDAVVWALLPLAISTWVIVFKYVVQTLEQVRQHVENLNKTPEALEQEIRAKIDEERFGAFSRVIESRVRN